MHTRAMHACTLELLCRADHPVAVECPPGFDRPALLARVSRLKPVLERLAGQSFVLDASVEDAGFVADLSIQRPGEGGRCIETVLALRFSNFGQLFTVWSVLPEPLPEPLVAVLVEAASAAGFHYVCTDELDEAYTGSHRLFRHASWWERYFDYF